MSTNTTARRLSAIILSASLTATAFAGLREVPSEAWQTKTSGSLVAPKNQGAALTAPDTSTNCVPGEIVVKLRQNSQAAIALDSVGTKSKTAAVAAAGTNELSALLGKHRATPLGTVFSRAKRDPSGASLRAKTVQDTQRDGLFRWQRLQIPKDADMKQVLADLKANPAVEYAEPVFEYRLAGEVPNATTDPKMGTQWHLAKIKAQQAWNYLQVNGLPMGGKRDVVVAVIDSGVDYNHEDLVGNMWTNPREIAGNGIDDDGNGFVDDIRGCSVVSDARSHSGNPIDLNGHGTHVAGIIAATAYNGKGGVGVAFNVQIMAIRAGQSSGILTTTDISEGILYAVDNGVEVINMSFGGPQRSQIMEEALQVALNQAVLVAAAGNGINGIGVSKQKLPFYPAALPYVLGVMSSTIDDKYALSSNTGYDLAAPGEGILSTWPGNRYSTSSGTSMAAPVVSGLAALIRSFWSQRELYSSRFVMGQVVNCAKIVADSPPGTPPVVDTFSAVTERAAPGVVLLENWLLDGKAISARNDADGRVDSGETINLGIVVQNRSGLASNMVATLAAPSDPYVTFLTNTVQFGNIGSMSTMDNGFIKTTDGVITGVERPFVFQVVSNCPNDHVIAFEITFTYRDGWNPENTHVFTPRAHFDYVVQRGKNVPGVISTNMVLAADDFWLVASPVLIEPGVTLTIGPGTQVQWGGVSDDPYNPGPQNGNIIVRGNLRVEGTSDRPVSFFPSYLVAGQLVTIAVEGGTADLAFVKVRNPNLTGFRNIDHGYFDWDFGATTITAQAINNSVFHKFRGGGTLAADAFERCLFDAGWLPPNSLGAQRAGWLLFNQLAVKNSVFLQDNENNRPISITSPVTIDKRFFGGVQINHPDFYDYTDPANWLGLYHAVTTNGFTYVTLPVELSDLHQAELIAQYFGGHVTSVANQAEQTLLETYLSQPSGVNQDTTICFLIGLSDDGSPGDYRWVDGSPMTYLHWAAGFPVVLPARRGHVVAIQNRLSGTWLGPWHNLNEFGPGRDNGAYYYAPAFILKLPGVWSAAQLNSQVANGNVLAFVRPRLESEITHNAFLSKYWDANINRWMRVLAGGGSTAYSAMNSNYWGTTSTELIDHLIVDYHDNFTTARVDYAPPVEHGYPTTYPFVEMLLVNGVSAETQPQLSAGRTEFTVTFNRDMNTNIEPFVTFGPSPPHTDFSVTARDADFHPMTNGWLNARAWQGAAQLSQFTIDGYQMMRISGAVAADDPWLVSGYDVGRFRFSVKTMGVLSMTLQAIGQEGSIQLSWQQNDYDLLAGYNLYRADSTNGPWTRLNDIVIPPGSESFTDTSVPPAVPKFYQFTVVTTDMRESQPSNLAVASALDTIAPVLTHTAVTSALPTRGLRISATATDNLRITSVTLFYRLSGSGSNYTSMAMVNVTGNDWSATIPGSAVQSPGVDYYLTATDGISEVFSGTPLLPHVVLVSNVPTLGSVTPNHGPSAGGTAVTLSGTLFEPGVSVLFGGVLASNVTLTSANQLTCLTPPHFPGLVDVTVMNTNGTQSTLLSAFQFEQTGVIVSLPVTNGNYGTQVELGLSAAGVAGLRAVDVTITFDPTVLSAVDARVGPLAAGWALSANLNNPGRAVLSLANASSITGSGSLVVLRFNIVKAPPASSALTIESVSLNDGAMTATRSHGALTVNGFFTLGGTVRYFGGGQAVPDVSLALVGAGALQTGSDTNGGFSITNIPTGSYTLTPTKTNQVAEITGYDAALVLQAAAGLLTLTPSQVLAADVNRNGTVSAMDASYILEKAVGLIEGAFPGAGRLWDFTPGQRSYSLLNSDQTGQDFGAVLLGDVSGNWTPPTTGSLSAPFAGRDPKGGDEPSYSVAIGMDNGPLPGSASAKSARVLLKTTNAPVYGIDLVLSYTPTSRVIGTVSRGGLAGTMALAANTNQPGLVRASLAGAVPLSGNGALFEVSFAGSDAVAWQIDQVRINEGLVPTVLETTLAAFDTDGDGLIDADEIAIFHTDPTRFDTDGDGMSDGAEVRAGTDPLSKTDVFSVVKAEATGGLTRVAWTVKASKTYQVLKSLDLRSWTDAPNGVGDERQSRRTAMTNGLLEYTDPEPANSGDGQTFYRVRLVE